MTRNIDDYTRVTAVLSPFSGLNLIDPEVLSNAANRGTCVHNLCDLLICLGFLEEEEIDSHIKKYARNDEHFEKEKKLIVKMLTSFDKWRIGKRFENKPERFFDDDLMITGECDMIYKNSHGYRVLVDLKTPVSVSKTWPLQGSAYSYMSKKSGLKIDFIVFVQLSRSNAEAKEHFYEENFPLFKSALDMYRYFYKDWKQPLNEDYL